MRQRYWLLALSIVALLWVPLVGWGASIVINVPPEAQVQGAQIILGDVAEIQGEPADTVARMRQVLLGQAPPAGVERLLSKSTLVSSNTRGCGRRNSNSKEHSRAASGVPASVLIHNTWRLWCGRRSSGVSHRPRSRPAFATFVGSARSSCRSDQYSMRSRCQGAICCSALPPSINIQSLAKSKNSSTAQPPSLWRRRW
jgi:hypothetical protein